MREEDDEDEGCWLEGGVASGRLSISERAVGVEGELASHERGLDMARVKV